MPSPEPHLRDRVYELLTNEDDGRVCRDIPEEACREQPQNFLKHVISLSLTKTGDGLVDPKLVLSWLLGALGAPAYLIGLLVPLRESGALLPQLFVAGHIRALPQRKWVWALGSLIQGLCVIGMALAALTQNGQTAGWTIIGLLAVMACARSICSVSYKDVLGKTVSKMTRGSATGTAASLSAALVLVFGLLLSAGVLDHSVAVIALVMSLGGVFWILAAILFSTLAENPGATEGGGNPISVVLEQSKLLTQDPQLVRFIATRGLLMVTALAPPFLLALAGSQGSGQLGQLGPFVVASSLAAVISGFVWGRLSDASSRKVLILAGCLAAAVLGASALLGLSSPGTLAQVYVGPTLLFVLVVAHQGVRLGRSTHIVDMTGESRRAAYTALSNTIVGVLLMIGATFALVAEVAGVPIVLVIFAVMAVGAILVATTLDEVQK